METSEQIVSMLERQQAMLEHIVGTLNKQDVKLDQHTAKLDEHSAMLVQINERLDQHTAILDKHSAILDKHSAILDKHTVKLEQHSATLKQHGAELVGIRAELTALNTKVDINHKLAIAEIRGHKKEMHDKLDEHKEDNDEQHRLIVQEVHKFVSSTEEYKHEVRILQREHDLTDRDVTKAFLRIEYMEKVLADPRES